MNVTYFFFFFQAEDGIRDAQESRGLGDVYKRQLVLMEPRSNWVVASRSLPHWTRAKLIAFNMEHLGEGPWEESPDDSLRLAARSVIDGHLESQHLGSLQQMNHDLMEIINNFGVNATATASGAAPVSAPTPAIQQAAAAPSPAPTARPPAPAPAPAAKGDHPRVVISYQSKQVDFMKKLVGYLNEHNIATVDGTQVGAGEDWRRFYFSALRKADILLPILSKSFIFSLACESELTYAEDKRKIIIPILCDPDYMAVLDTPELYIDMDPDIELRGPKLGAILQQHNRFPANDKFADDFSKNAAKLLARVQAELAKKGVTTAAGGHGDPPQWTFEGRKEDSTIHKTVKFIPVSYTHLTLPTKRIV
eukprot:TRINITY_DN3483_c0_g1_i5.p1 TRINITY_DN3483_c0_g1~~TRINITY_DN3483_c0_g1_i5.p1  ORF type:complete len:364 (-),score=87.63 TRINITY_DN3483_c0_g1_i5:126-1217(-)